MTAPIVVITGTGTGVGKTVVTAAVASVFLTDGQRVAVVKPAQTGLLDDEPGDLADVERLTGNPDELTTIEFIRYADPLAPAAAARRAGSPTLALEAAVADITALTDSHDLVIVEGAGGLLVEFTDEPAWTLADLARSLDAPVLVVVDPALGTLNHTALTYEALASRGLSSAGVIIGAWPAEPDLACRSNLRDLDRISAGSLTGVIPSDSGTQSPADFAATALAGLSPALGGHFNAADFIESHDPKDPQ